jgi:glycosyltransferase involved in cell wall biosynthesis
MRILHTETLKRWGGQQNRVLAESQGLSQRGHTVIIACNRGSTLAGKARDAGIRVYELNLEKQAHPANILKLVRIIRKEEIEIVATHSSVDSWAGGIAARLTGRKLVRFRHNLYPVGRDPLTRMIYAAPDRIVAISSAVRDALVARGIRGDRITVIHSSVDVGRFGDGVRDIRDELRLLPETVVIGNTSTFKSVKGLKYLFQAFNAICRQVPCILLLAGRVDESGTRKFLADIDEDLRERVIFLGHREDIPRVLRTIDVYVYPSVLEGLGTALIEAMAAERPVVLSDIPTFRYFVRDKKDGLFFTPRDPGDIADKVLWLLRNRGEAVRIGRNARKTAMEQFSLSAMIDLTESLYVKMLT